MFTVSVFADVITRTLGDPWVWLQQVTTAFFAGVFLLEWPLQRVATTISI